MTAGETVPAGHTFVEAPTEEDPDDAYCSRCLGTRRLIVELNVACPGDGTEPPATG